jgi:hypothetical protein
MKQTVVLCVCVRASPNFINLTDFQESWQTLCSFYTSVFVLLDATTAQIIPLCTPWKPMASVGIAPLIRNLDEGEWSASHPTGLFLKKGPPLPTEKEVGCAPEPAGALRRRYEVLTPAWRRTATCRSLYRLLSCKSPLSTEQSLYIWIRAVQWQTSAAGSVRVWIVYPAQRSRWPTLSR